MCHSQVYNPAQHGLFEMCTLMDLMRRHFSKAASSFRILGTNHIRPSPTPGIRIQVYVSQKCAGIVREPETDSRIKVQGEDPLAIGTAAAAEIYDLSNFDALLSRQRCPKIATSSLFPTDYYNRARRLVRNGYKLVKKSVMGQVHRFTSYDIRHLAISSVFWKGTLLVCIYTPLDSHTGGSFEN